MAQEIKQGNIWGRIGSGLGKGLAEQLPQEIERGRLASGLQQLSQQEGLTPFQSFAGLASLPGTTPQIIQSGADLLKQQQIRDAYRNRDVRQGNPNTQASPSFRDVPYAFGNKPGIQQNPQGLPGQVVPSDLSRTDEALSNPPAASENPLSSQFIPPAPWNQERQEAAINEAFDRGIATTFPEAVAYANNQRDLYEQAPEKYRNQLDYKRGVDKQVDDLFDGHLQTRLQKEGTETFKDLTGDLQLNLKKLARNSVATGKMTPDQAAEYYSKKGLDLAKDKGQVLKIANRDVLDRILPHKKNETVKSLINIGKTFDELGSSEEYYNLLKSDQIDESGRQQGLGLSPGGASVIAYPRTSSVRDLIKKTYIDPKGKKPSEETRKFADELFKVMTPKDSFLAIAREMKQKEYFFDEYAFFDYLRENRDQYGSNPRLNREVNEGVSDFFPNWRDIGLFPVRTK